MSGFFLLFLTLILVHRKWLPSSLALFALGVLMLPYLTITGGPERFSSMTRYILLAFPRFHCDGEFMQEPALARSVHHGIVCSALLGGVAEALNSLPSP